MLKEPEAAGRDGDEPRVSQMDRAGSGARGQGRFRHWPMLLAVVFVVVCTLVPEAPLVWSGNVPLRRDNLHIFYPLNDLTGKILRSGQLPVWNPYQMGGMPLMGDPEAGWGSLSSMIAYAFLPLGYATAATLAAQKALAAVGTLLWVRATGASLPGAVLSALAYGLSGPLLGPLTNTSYGNLSYIGTYAWFPWMLLGAEIALRQRGRARLVGWCLLGFAGSQELSVWAGQGAYYAFLGTAAYVTFQTLLGSAAGGLGLLARVRALLAHSVVMGAVTILLSAWTLFPRLEFVLASNLRGGYDEGEQQFGPGALATLPLRFFQLGGAYVGAGVIALAIGALLLRPSRLQWFYAGMFLVTYLASLWSVVEIVESSSLLRFVFGLVPGALQLHFHDPQRIVFVGLLFGAALAGSALDSALTATGARRVGMLAAMMMAAGVPVIVGPGALALDGYWLFYLGSTVFVSLLLLAWRGGPWARAAALLIVVLTASELIYAVFTFHGGSLASMGDPRRYYNAASVRASVDLLSSMPQQRARYFGYSPLALQRRPDVVYRAYLWAPWSLRLLATSQATVHRLEDVQGYNPLHLQVYDALLSTANGGRSENYRNAYITSDALHSPLLQMLNVRYVLTTSGTKLGPPYELRSRHKQTWLYENTRALPRAWVVHGLLMSADGDRALQLINEGEVDPRETGVVSRPVSGVRPRAGADSTAITEYQAGRITVRARLASTGLLVLAELDYPAWKVEVDGKPAQVVRANGALRAVRVPEGTHTVVWRFDSTPTRLGFALSTLGVLALAALYWLMPGLTRVRVLSFMRLP